MTGLELREIRKKLTLSRRNFAGSLGISVHTLDAWEQGKRNIPDAKAEFIKLKIKDIVPMKIKFDHGKMYVGEELEEYIKERDKQEDALQKYNIDNILVQEPSEIFKTKTGTVFTESADGSYILTVPLVPFDAYASYVESFQDEVAVLDDWEKVSFRVEKVHRGKYLGFKTKGDSMNGGGINDTPDRALILGRELQRHHWKDGFKASDYGWVIISKFGMMHKDITNLNLEEGTITCHSRNPSPEFRDFEMELNDIFQIFKIHKRTF